MKTEIIYDHFENSTYSQSSCNEIMIFEEKHFIDYPYQLDAAWQSLQYSLDQFIDQYFEIIFSEKFTTNFNSKNLSRTFQSILREATIIHDVMKCSEIDTQIKKKIDLIDNAELRKMRNISKNLRKSSAMLDNELKHNSRTLVNIYAIENITKLRVAGFMVCDVSKKGIISDKKFNRGHPKSYIFAVQDIIGCLYKSDYLLGQIIDQTCSEKIMIKVKMLSYESIFRLNSIPSKVFPEERYLSENIINAGDSSILMEVPYPRLKGTRNTVHLTNMKPGLQYSIYGPSRTSG